MLILTIAYMKGYKKQTETPKPKTSKPKTKTLSELQITACNAADKAQTCDTRLVEVGIVTKEECCDVLEKCC